MQLKRKVPNCLCIVYIQIQAMTHNEQQVHLCVLLMYTADEWRKFRLAVLINSFAEFLVDS